MKNFLKYAARLLLVPLAVGLLALLLLALCFLLPTEGIRAHVRATAGVLREEGMYFSLTGESGERHDNFIDALYLDQAIVGPGDADLPAAVLHGYDFVHTDPADPIDNVLTAVSDPSSVSLADTEKRFFNGHLIVLKPLLLLMGYTGVRMFCLYGCLGLTALLGFLLWRRGFGRAVLPVMLSVLFLRPLAVWMNFAFSLIYVCMLAPCILILLLPRQALRQRGGLLFALSGAVTFCLSMNYFQLLSFGLPVLLVLLVVGLPPRPAALLKTLADLFAAWLVGYAGAMVFKWAVYSLVSGENIFGAMLNHALWRSGLDEGSRLDALLKNARVAFGSLWWDLSELAFAAVCALRALRRKSRPPRCPATPAADPSAAPARPPVDLPASAPARPPVDLPASASARTPAARWTLALFLGLMLLIPAARLLLLANHSIVHADFVYRLFMMPVLAANLALSGAWRRHPIPAKEPV